MAVSRFTAAFKATWSDAPVVLPVQFIERGSSGPAPPNKP